MRLWLSTRPNNPILRSGYLATKVLVRDSKPWQQFSSLFKGEVRGLDAAIQNRSSRTWWLWHTATGASLFLSFAAVSEEREREKGREDEEKEALKHPVLSLCLYLCKLCIILRETVTYIHLMPRTCRDSLV